jgi:hypothetical protein
LGLSTKEEPNLLTFGPTKEGLASRANELKNLYVPSQRCNNCGSNVKGSYISHPTLGLVRSCCARASQGGKRKTRKAKKSKKTRKMYRK